MTEETHPLSIDRSLFTMAFGRDVDYDSVHPQVAWLDRRTGDVIWVYENDGDACMEAGFPAEENRRDRERVAAAPDRYLEIPGLVHGDHHDILKAFLQSDWCEDEARLHARQPGHRVRPRIEPVPGAVEIVDFRLAEAIDTVAVEHLDQVFAVQHVKLDEFARAVQSRDGADSTC